MSKRSIFGGAVALELPPAWDDRSTFTFVAPTRTLTSDLPTLAKQRGFRPNVVVAREASSGAASVDAYAKDQLAKLSHSLGTLTAMEVAELRIGGLPVPTRSFKFMPPGQLTSVQQTQLYVLRGPWIYTVTFTTLEACFDEDRQMFEAFLTTLTFV